MVFRTITEVDVLADNMDQAKKLRNRLKGRLNLQAAQKEIHTLKVETLADAFGIGSRQRMEALLGRLALLDPHTREIEPLAFLQRGARPMDWSQDHGRMLFIGPSSRVTQLFEWDRETDEVRQLTTDRWEVLSGCAGPDGAIAYSRFDPYDEIEKTGGARIYLRRPGTAGPVRVSEGPGDAWPRWSRDGRWLAWEAFDLKEGSLIKVLDLETPDAEIRVVGKGAHPAMSPDGEWLVYSANTRKGPKLVKVRMDGSARRSFGASPYHETEPTISPDGRHVLYVGLLPEEEGLSQLLARPLDGGNDIPLVLPSAGGAALPVW